MREQVFFRWQKDTEGDKVGDRASLIAFLKESLTFNYIQKHTHDVLETEGGTFLAQGSTLSNKIPLKKQSIFYTC